MDLRVIVFDLDGTLIDSEDMIKASYLEAGVTPPDDILSLGHHDWIEEEHREAVHARKNAAYLRRLAQGYKTLPPWSAAEKLDGAGYETAILTGAPEGTIIPLVMRAPSWPFLAARVGVTPAEKALWLEDQDYGTYVDDQRHVVLPCNWKFVHYTGQSAEELLEEVFT